MAILSWSEITLKRPTAIPPRMRRTARGVVRLISVSIRLLLACGTVWAMGSLCTSSCGAQEGPSEYQVKAAFLFNFGKFVEWPEGSFANSQAPFWVCVLGDDPFGATLDETLRGKTIGGHTVSITRIKDSGSARGCQIVFVSDSEKARLPALLASTRGWNALLVGETEGFAASGGAIQFMVEDKHVRFAINPDAIHRAGLQVSSKLLALATIVHDRPKAGKG